MVGKIYMFSYLHSLLLNPACLNYVSYLLVRLLKHLLIMSKFEHLLCDNSNGGASDILPLKGLLLNTKNWALFSLTVHMQTLRVKVSY